MLKVGVSISSWATDWELVYSAAEWRMILYIKVEAASQWRGASSSDPLLYYSSIYTFKNGCHTQENSFDVSILSVERILKRLQRAKISHLCMHLLLCCCLWLNMYCSFWSYQKTSRTCLSAVTFKQRSFIQKVFECSYSSFKRHIRKKKRIGVADLSFSHCFCYPISFFLTSVIPKSCC